MTMNSAFYVALGSSFAAGLGLGSRAPGSPLVSQRSQNGYPQQLARMLKLSSFIDMTSSGATILQVLKGGQMYLGPQVDALGPETRLVTLTAGGNDISYIGDLVALAFRNRGGILGFLLKLFWSGPKRIEERGFDALRANFAELLKEIHRRSPDARIFIATYPSIFPMDDDCSLLGLTEEQIQLMRPVADTLAEITRATAHEAGATLVDIAALSVGHDACSNDPWVNGPFPKKGEGSWFHPTLAGAKASAEAILTKIHEVELRISEEPNRMNTHIDEISRDYPIPLNQQCIKRTQQ